MARAATGRDAVIKFAGCYHGHADGFLVEAGSGAATLGVPTSPGVPKAAAALTLTARYNDLASVESVAGTAKGGVAAVLVEPIAGNMGLVPPEPGFLEGLRALCDRTGALLVFDEVISGFRASRGGAQQLLGVRPDLTCLGKIIGGGLPVGAYGGREDLMRRVAPDGPVYQAGTLSGNPLAMTAGLWALSQLSDKLYAKLERLGAPARRGPVRCRAPRRHRRQHQSRRVAAHGLLPRSAGDELRRREGVRHRGVRAVLPGDARAGHLPATVAVRGVVPVGRARHA